MRYLEFREAFKDFVVFSVGDIRKVDRHFYPARLVEWQKKGHIRKVIRGFYIFTSPSLDELVLFEIANRIYRPSYISFDMALSFYHMIPESVYGLTSATTRKTNRFKTGIGHFSYHTLRPRLFFGYRLVDHRGRRLLIAEPEKAFLDYFYIHYAVISQNDFEEMRIDREQYLSLVDSNRLIAYASEFGQKRLVERVKSFNDYIAHA